MAAYVNSFSDLNFSPPWHAPAAWNTRTFSTYFMTVPISTTYNVCLELLLKHLSFLIHSWSLLGWWSDAYVRKSNLCSFHIGIDVITSNVQMHTSSIPESNLTSHLVYLTLQFIVRSIIVSFSSHSILSFFL